MLTQACLGIPQEAWKQKIMRLEGGIWRTLLSSHREKGIDSRPWLKYREGEPEYFLVRYRARGYAPSKQTPLFDSKGWNRFFCCLESQDPLNWHKNIQKLSAIVCNIMTARLIPLSTHLFSGLILPLKVVGNEKGGGSGGWLLLEDAFGPWRSMSVYFLMLPLSFPQRISVSCL